LNVVAFWKDTLAPTAGGFCALSADEAWKTVSFSAGLVSALTSLLPSRRASSLVSFGNALIILLKKSLG
jgi:hypothetical protein